MRKEVVKLESSTSCNFKNLNHRCLSPAIEHARKKHRK